MNHDGSVNVIPFGHEVRKQDEPALVLKKFSRQVAVIEEGGSDSGQAGVNFRIRIVPMQELRVDNLIDRLVRPSRYAKPLKPEQVERCRKDLFAKVREQLSASF